MDVQSSWKKVTVSAQNKLLKAKVNDLEESSKEAATYVDEHVQPAAAGSTE